MLDLTVELVTLYNNTSNITLRAYIEQLQKVILAAGNL